MNARMSMTAPTRVASWLRRNYPRQAPEHGHNYLIALCGANTAR